MPPFGFLPGDYSFRLGSFDALSYLSDHVEMVLNIFQRAVVRQFLEQGLNFVLCGIHDGLQYFFDAFGGSCQSAVLGIINVYVSFSNKRQDSTVWQVGQGAGVRRTTWTCRRGKRRGLEKMWGMSIVVGRSHRGVRVGERWMNLRIHADENAQE